MKFCTLAALEVAIFGNFQCSQWWPFHQNDIFQCSQWQKKWCQNDNIYISMFRPVLSLKWEDQRGTARYHHWLHWYWQPMTTELSTWQPFIAVVCELSTHRTHDLKALLVLLKRYPSILISWGISGLEGAGSGPLNDNSWKQENIIVSYHDHH